MSDEKLLRDAIVYGTGMSVGGERIDPTSIYKKPEKEPTMTKPLMDEDGENRAVRMFLAAYNGLRAVTIEQMRMHLTAAGYEGCWPAWANTTGHLTKSGAQDWLRHLFGLEK